MLFAAPNQFLCAYAGLALVAGWAVAEILTLVRGPRRWLVTASCALLLAACGSSTTQKNDASKAASAAAESGGSSADTLVSPAMTAQQWLALSLYAYNHKRFLESLAAAQTALKLQPNYPEAENNVAAAYSALHQWDLSIGAAQEALRLKPDFPLARNNLNWAMEQKRLGAH
jgi:tetratricopeptide (TPR) repeat protein